jgi:2-oxoglutarate ferredoxin oxidoreductase subunit beta
MDRDTKHLQEMIRRSHAHQGTSFLEIYQNCNIFNDGAFEVFTEKGSKPVETLYVEQGQPLRFGVDGQKGIRLNGLHPEVVDLGTDFSADDLWIHDESDVYKAQTLVRLFDDVQRDGHFPRPFGVFYATQRAVYEEQLHEQIQKTKAAKGLPSLDTLLAGNETWTVL